MNKFVNNYKNKEYSNSLFRTKKKLIYISFFMYTFYNSTFFVLRIPPNFTGYEA